MYKITYSVVLLSIFGNCGGDIIPIDSYVGEDLEVDSPKIIVNINKKLNKSSIRIQEVKEINHAMNTGKYYVGISVSQASFDSKINSGILRNGHPLGLIAKVGYNFNENIALETRIGTGIKKDTISGIDNELSLLVGAYVKPKISVVKGLELFGLLGYGAIKQDVDNTSVNSKGLSYGMGTSYSVGRNWNMTVDLVRYESKTIGTNDTYNFGSEYKF